MTHFSVQDMLENDRKLFLEWFKENVLDPDSVKDGVDVAEDGLVTGERFLIRDGERVWGVSVPFTRWSAKPLPDRFLED